MDWIVLKANPDTERQHLNRILQDIAATIGQGDSWETVAVNFEPQSNTGYTVDASGGTITATLPVVVVQGYTTTLNAHGGEVHLNTNGHEIDGLTPGDVLVLEDGNSAALAAREDGLLELIFGTAGTTQQALQFKNEGSALGVLGGVASVDFVGAGVDATIVGDAVTVTITATGSGGGNSFFPSGW